MISQNEKPIRFYITLGGSDEYNAILGDLDNVMLVVSNYLKNWSPCFITIEAQDKEPLHSDSRAKKIHLRQEFKKFTGFWPEEFEEKKGGLAEFSQGYAKALLNILNDVI